MEPVEPVLKNIYESNTYKKDLSWPHFDHGPSIQEKQQVKDLTTSCPSPQRLVDQIQVERPIQVVATDQTPDHT